jgi:hypothetical protein
MLLSACLGCSAVEFGNPGGNYEKPCITRKNQTDETNMHKTSLG